MFTHHRVCTYLVFAIIIGLMVPFWGCESQERTAPLISVLQQTPSVDRAVLQTQRMVTKLNLSEEQIPKIHAINLNYANSAQAIAFADTPQPTKIEELGRLLDNKDIALQQVLSSSQMQAYQQMKAASEENLKEFGGR